MSIIVERFKKIQSDIISLNPAKPVNIIAVSKTFDLDHIKPLIDYGHLHFGENKVQEATAKWTEQKKNNQNLKLHMIGKLQSNKAKDAVKLFDYIHSLDNQKLADALAKFQVNLKKKLQYFIQVNIGNEIQKSGISVNELDSFYNYCVNEINLKIIGLMVIPPVDQDPKKYFKSLLRQYMRIRFSFLRILFNSFKLFGFKLILFGIFDNNSDLTSKFIILLTSII